MGEERIIIKKEPEFVELKPCYNTKTVEVDHFHEQLVEVEIPEKRFERIVKHVPSIQGREVDLVVEVPEIYEKEELVKLETWDQQTYDYLVPRRHVKEEVDMRVV